MQPERDLERAVAGWLMTAPTAAAPAGLHDVAMAELRSRRQHPMGVAVVRTGVWPVARPLVRLVAIAAIAGAIIAAGAALALSMGAMTRTDDLLGQRTSRDPIPFAYVIPANSGLEQDPPARGWVMGWSADPHHPRSSIDPAKDGVGPSWDADRGIVLAVGPMWGHADTGRYLLPTEPAAFLEDLRGRLGFGVGPIEATTVDGRPAVTADIRSLKSDLHYGTNTGGLSGGQGYSLRFPSRLVVTNVNGRPLLIQIWGRNHVVLDEWLPTAMQFVDSIRFLDAAPTPTPGSP